MSKISDLKKQINRLEFSLKELTLLNELAFAVSSSTDVGQVLDMIVKKSIKAVKAEQGSIMLVKMDEDDPLSTLIRYEDFSGSKKCYKIGTHISGWVLKYKKPLLIENLAEDKRFNVKAEDSRKLRSILCLPIKFQAELIGIIIMANKKSGGPFNDDDLRLLSIIAAQSGQLIKNSHLQQEAIKKIHLEHELILAENMQRSLLPKEEPVIKGIDIASYFKPMGNVGGDYYDYFYLDKDRLGIIIADVSGHGPSAAMIMTMIKGVLHSIIRNVTSADQTLSELRSIISQIIPMETFVTLQFIIFDIKKKTMQFANAGHMPIIHYIRKKNVVETLELSGIALNGWDLLKESSCKLYEISLEKEDIFFIYTDGVSEAINHDFEMFRISGIQDSLKETATEPAINIIKHMQKKLNTFTGDSAQEDDIVMIAVKV